MLPHASWNNFIMLEFYTSIMNNLPNSVEHPIYNIKHCSNLQKLYSAIVKPRVAALFPELQTDKAVHSDLATYIKSIS